MTYTVTVLTHLNQTMTIGAASADEAMEKAEAVAREAQPTAVLIEAIEAIPA